MSLPLLPTSLARLLKGAPLACLFVLMCSDQPLRAGQMCQASGYSANSVTAALRLLVDLGLVRRCDEGWRAVDGLVNLLFRQPSAPAASAEGCWGERAGLQTDALASNRESFSSGGGVNPRDLIPMPPPPEEKAQCAAREFDSSPAAVGRILEASALLFGEHIHGPPSRYPDAHLLLASIAEAYARRHTLHKPARVVYANLKRGVNPGSSYLANPLASLPREFLIAAGLPAPPEDQPAESLDDDADELWEADAPPDEAQPLLQAHPSTAQPVNGVNSRSAAQAWQTALENLRMELSRPIFSAWVEGCYLARYEMELNAFWIAAPDEMHALWLSDRLKPRLEQLLTGICNRQAQARFEIPADLPDLEAAE